MCGRYTLTVDQEALAAALGVEVLLEDHPRPRFNIAPTQAAPVWTATGVRPLRWGLVPSWADDASGAGRLINARSETVTRKPSFREAFRTGRCLVPADGFYEWVTPGARSEGEGGGAAGKKAPWWIHRSDRAVLTFAGIRAQWSPPGGGPELETFTILTCEAAGEIRSLHHRMPVVVVPELRHTWLETGRGRGHPSGSALPADSASPGGPSRSEPDSLVQSVVEAAREAVGEFRAHPVSGRCHETPPPSSIDPVPRGPPPAPRPRPPSWRRTPGPIEPDGLLPGPEPGESGPFPRRTPPALHGADGPPVRERPDHPHLVGRPRVRDAVSG
jgi:putative SOS response-associated peptidase YedK